MLKWITDSKLILTERQINDSERFSGNLRCDYMHMEGHLKIKLITVGRWKTLPCSEGNPE
jgi:hypothetical protein